MTCMVRICLGELPGMMQVGMHLSCQRSCAAWQRKYRNHTSGSFFWISFLAKMEVIWCASCQFVCRRQARENFSFFPARGVARALQLWRVQSAATCCELAQTSTHGTCASLHAGHPCCLSVHSQRTHRQQTRRGTHACGIVATSRRARFKRCKLSRIHTFCVLKKWSFFRSFVTQKHNFAFRFSSKTAEKRI